MKIIFLLIGLVAGFLITYIVMRIRYANKAVGTFHIDTTPREGTMVYAEFDSSPDDYIHKKQITFNVHSL